MKERSRSLLSLVVAIVLAGFARAGVPEVECPAAARKGLDPIAAKELEAGDAAFAGKDYAAAQAKYKAFVDLAPESPAVPYALLRQGRSLQLRKQRASALKLYDEVLDYFPDDHYADGAACFYKGLVRLELCGTTSRDWSVLLKLRRGGSGSYEVQAHELLEESLKLPFRSGNYPSFQSSNLPFLNPGDC